MKKVLLIGLALTLLFDGFWVTKYIKEGTSVENWAAFFTINVLIIGLGVWKGAKGK